MAGDVGGLEDLFLPELFLLSRGKKDIPSWIHNSPKGSVNQKGALFACRYLSIGQKKEILDWLLNQETFGHCALFHKGGIGANEFGSTVYSWMHEFIVVASLQRAMIAGDGDVESACLRWLAYHKEAHETFALPNGTIIMPGCRCKHLDSISRQLFHNLLTDRPIPAEFLDRWDKWSLNRGNWNCLILREIKSKISLPDLGFPKLLNPVKFAKWDHGHAAYFDHLDCANSPLWYVSVDYSDGKVDSILGNTKGGDNPNIQDILAKDPARKYLILGE